MARRRGRRTASARATAQPWLPLPDDWAASPSPPSPGTTGSTLVFYRAALRGAARHALPAGDEVDCVAVATGDVLELRRGDADACCSTAAPRPVRLPAGEVLVAAVRSSDVLPPDTASGSAEPDRSSDGPPRWGGPL